jgi:hypothetical protein
VIPIRRRPRNKRVKRIVQRTWRKEREDKVRDSIRYAAAARAYRTALGVTQEEMGARYDRTGASVCHWESGFYFGWDDEELSAYCRMADRIAGENGR